MRKKFTLEIFEDKDGKSRIHLSSLNGRIIMSSEAYSKPDKAKKTMKSVWLAMIGNQVEVKLSSKELAK
jgi:uncharacterized protein YegP (UPF0339 family)